MSPRYLFTAVVLLALGFASIASAQRPGRGARPTGDSSVSDPELLGLHKEFVSKAEKLAAEYERKKNLDGAREVYESMTRLIPEYEAAQLGLKRILNAQSTQDRKVVEVQANRDWQDTQIILVKGNPVHIEAKGTWFVVNETDANGLVIPKEIDPKNNKIKLGTLIGMIVSQPDVSKLKPFPIGNGTDFIAPETGRLVLRMFDVEPRDNKGSMSVLVQSTFGRP
ncbi:hypothetical protein [Rosistilla oblonga]|uniref:Uncharacterized protein n=1 Tax=Rosistilla oblonga TaxID=2527990 RepID=A0A518IPV4_9BACT|nr:hypothetical protein [Rosistilla oblonga]QDV55125.1 hypothetical protein Mal33_10940 [Rosistilla oblonga]